MSHWVFDPISLACLIASGALYVAGVSRLRARAGRGCGVRSWQLGAFAAGWIALVIALLSPVAAISEVLFSVHMTQHEILIVGRSRRDGECEWEAGRKTITGAPSGKR